MWSLGVIVYNMFSGGKYPFGNRMRRNREAGVHQVFMFEIMEDIKDDINNDRSKFELPCWSRVSEDAKVLHTHHSECQANCLVSMYPV